MAIVVCVQVRGIEAPEVRLEMALLLGRVWPAGLVRLDCAGQPSPPHPTHTTTGYPHLSLPLTPERVAELGGWETITAQLPTATYGTERLDVLIDAGDLNALDCPWPLLAVADLIAVATAATTDVADAVAWLRQALPGTAPPIAVVQVIDPDTPARRPDGRGDQERRVAGTVLDLTLPANGHHRGRARRRGTRSGPSSSAVGQVAARLHAFAHAHRQHRPTRPTSGSSGWTPQPVQAVQPAWRTRPDRTSAVVPSTGLQPAGQRPSRREPAPVRALDVKTGRQEWTGLGFTAPKTRPHQLRAATGNPIDAPPAGIGDGQNDTGGDHPALDVDVVTASRDIDKAEQAPVLRAVPTDAPPTNHHDDEPASGGPDGGVVVRLLGPVELRGCADPALQSGQALAIAAYLALHPAGVDRDQFDTALWGRQVPTATRRTALRRLRRCLGHTPDGQRLLPPPGPTGTLRLHDQIRSDWGQFQRLTTAPANEPTGDRLARLDQALELVAGRPLETISGYVWADDHAQEMTQAITTAAVEAAELHLDRGTLPAARAAVTAGMRADPTHEQLWQLKLRIAHAAGHRTALPRLYDSYLTQLRELELEPDPDTSALYQHLTDRHGDTTGQTGTQAA